MTSSSWHTDGFHTPMNPFGRRRLPASFGHMENEMLVSFLAGQREALRNAVAGLTEEQARSVPSASKLSLAVLIKHAINGEMTMTDRIAGTVPDEEPVARWASGWQLNDDETLEVLLGRWAEVSKRTNAVLAAERDLNREVPIPPAAARWLPSSFDYTVRWLVLHEIEELARHAGHADIIRESIDGAVGHGVKQVRDT